MHAGGRQDGSYGRPAARRGVSLHARGGPASSAGGVPLPRTTSAIASVLYGMCAQAFWPIPWARERSSTHPVQQGIVSRSRSSLLKSTRQDSLGQGTDDRADSQPVPNKPPPASRRGIWGQCVEESRFHELPTHRLMPYGHSMARGRPCWNSHLQVQSLVGSQCNAPLLPPASRH